MDINDYREYGMISNCCGANVIMTDICEACKEHCDPIPEDEYYED
jgi:hypothetical protein